MSSDVVIETPRLQLARFRSEDLSTHLRFMASPEIVRVLPMAVPPEIATAIFQQILELPEEQGVHLAIWTRESPRLIGGIGLGNRNLRDMHAGLSASIGETSEWNKGYGTEAARALIQYGIEKWSLRKVWLNHHGFNHAARAIADKLGFVEVGRERDHCLVDDEWTDWVTMELFASDVAPE